MFVVSKNVLFLKKVFWKNRTYILIKKTVKARTLLRIFLSILRKRPKYAKVNEMGIDWIQVNAKFEFGQWGRSLAINSIVCVFEDNLYLPRMDMRRSPNGHKHTRNT